MFTVIIPVYNKFPHLERSINSVLNQTYKDFELIIVDDASTDGSSVKIREFSDPRIKLFQRKTPGPGGYAARNLGILNAKYEWINFLDADDEWDLNLLARIKEIIEGFEPDIVSCGLRVMMNNKEIPDKIFGINKDKIIEFSLVDYLKTYQFISTDTITLKRNLIIKSGMFPDNGICKRGGDMDTWIRCLLNSNRNIRLNEPLAYYYKDADNRVADDKINMPQLYCPYNFLQELRSKTKDQDLLKAIDFLCNKLIFGVLATKVNMGFPIDYKLMRQMRFDSIFGLRLIKLHLKRFSFLLHKKPK